jgi:hypothetical protein
VPLNTGDFHFSDPIVLILSQAQANPNRWDSSFSSIKSLEPKEENQMEVKIFRRHSADCPDKAGRYASRCGGPLWGVQLASVQNHSRWEEAPAGAEQVDSQDPKWFRVLRIADPLDVQDWAQRSHQCLTSS